MQTGSSQSSAVEKLKVGRILTNSLLTTLLSPCLATRHSETNMYSCMLLHQKLLVGVCVGLCDVWCVVCVCMCVFVTAAGETPFPCRTRPGEITIVIYSLLCCHGDSVQVCLCVVGGGQGPFLRAHYQYAEINLWFALRPSKQRQRAVISSSADCWVPIKATDTSLLLGPKVAWFHLVAELEKQWWETAVSFEKNTLDYHL